MNCVPCAVTSIATVAAAPIPRADYVVDGQSMCGPCALPHLYRIADRGGRKTAAERIRDAQPLFTAITQAHEAAGHPSLRAMQQTARDHGHYISHTSIHDFLAGKRLPSRGTVEAVAAATGADLDQLIRLWRASF
jgi:hypothetical protein